MDEDRSTQYSGVSSPCILPAHTWLMDIARSRLMVVSHEAKATR